MPNQLALFFKDVGRYPTTEEGLSALLRAPQGAVQLWKGPYISSDRLPLDPWGREYQYRSPALKSKSGYDVWSLGPDGVLSADDIGNWTK
ncbi:MAG: type II secretion system protein GspG [Opitutaceae bacterium]|nr:type II secretion system protein GspG [Opitutaceae bacterium]